MTGNLPLKKKLRISISDVVYKANIFIPPANAEGFRVLLYHSITDRLIENEWEESTINVELFERQVKYLVDKKYNIVSCKKAVSFLINKEEVPVKTIAITFDDGYRDNYTNALPVLREYNVCATVFLTLDFLNDSGRNRRHFNRAEIVNMKKSGLIDFGCHGKTHKILPMLNGKELNEEIALAKENLEHLTETKIDLFAYPYGHSSSYDDKVIEKIKSAGFGGAFTNISGLNDFRKNCFLLRRNRISWLDELPEFKKHLEGAYDWCSLFECFRKKRYS